jgi:hypothetical protein
VSPGKKKTVPAKNEKPEIFRQRRCVFKEIQSARQVSSLKKVGNKECDNRTRFSGTGKKSVEKPGRRRKTY